MPPARKDSKLFDVLYDPVPEIGDVATAYDGDVSACFVSGHQTHVTRCVTRGSKISLVRTSKHLCTGAILRYSREVRRRRESKTSGLVKTKPKRLAHCLVSKGGGGSRMLQTEASLGRVRAWEASACSLKPLSALLHTPFSA